MSRREFKLQKATQIAETILRNCMAQMIPIEFNARNRSERDLAARTIANLRRLIIALCRHLGDPSPVTKYKESRATAIEKLSYANLLENTEVQMSALMIEVNILRDVVEFAMLEIIQDQLKRLPDNDCVYELTQIYQELCTPNLITDQCRRSIEHNQYLAEKLSGSDYIDTEQMINKD
jgi:hypothetical protein